MTLSSEGQTLVVGLSVALMVAVFAITLYMCRKHRRKSVRLNTPIFTRLVRDDMDHRSHGGSLHGGSSRYSRTSRYEDDDGGGMADATVSPLPSPPQSPTASHHGSNHTPTHSRSGSVGSHIEYEVGRTPHKAREIKTHTTLIIPNGLQLLKTCKRLTHRLMATVIDFTSSNNGQGLVVGSRDEIVSCARTVSDAVDALTKSMYPPIDDADILDNATGLVNATEDLVLVSKFNCKQDKLDWLDKATKDVLHDFKVLVDSVQKYRNLHKKGYGADYVTEA